jgi:hypothetical protein
MIVELSQEEVRVCTMLATERWLTKFDSVDRPNYAKGKAEGRLEHELLANIRANVSEWAVARAYSLSWNVPWYPNRLHPLRKNIPDVGEYEVRTIRTATAIPFWNKDLKRRIYGTKILDDEYYSQVEVYGYFEPEEILELAHRDESINGWRMPLEHLKND